MVRIPNAALLNCALRSGPATLTDTDTGAAGVTANASIGVP